MMSKKLESIINFAIKLANELHHEFLTLESIFFAMLEDRQVVEILEDCGVSVGELKKELKDFLYEDENFSILSEKSIEKLSKEQFIDDELRELAKQSGVIYQPEISLALQRVIQRAAIHVQSSGKSQIRGINLLVAMFQEKESFALYLLEKRGVERFDIIKSISHGVDRPLSGVESSDQREGEAVDDEKGRKKEGSALEKYTLNLNKLAEEGKIDPLIGRKSELTRIIQILCRRRKNNPMMVGEAGVGKTAIAEGLALLIANGDVPEVLLKTQVFSLDMASLLAGAKFRGDFEARLKSVVKEMGSLEEKGIKPVLFIDEIHTLMGAGSTGGGSMDASNLLKPSLATGKIRCMGSTTYEEFRRFIEKDSAFSRRFQKVEIDEPTMADTIKILQGLRGKFESHHGVKYSNSILKLAVDLSERYITDRKNPDKSIDVIDEAGARIQLLPTSKRRANITKKDIEETVAKIARVPKVSVVGEERNKLKGLKEKLDLMIYGQDAAVRAVTDAILLSRSGLGNEDRPMASFLFAGPTGVGKTELAKQLALQLNSHLERFDMSEYMEKHSIAKLIGAPPGYVGFEQGGGLTDAIKKHPHCILLLDEIEKGHPDIYNTLLQVMDYGKLTDSHGRTTDFRNTVIIMTTNLGSKEMAAGTIGLGSGGKKGLNKANQAIKNYFSPEFRNRLDAIVHFNPLSRDLILKIVDKFLMELESKLVSKGIDLEVSMKAKIWLSENGFDEKMGARPLGRIIDEKIKRPLSKEILFGPLNKGGKVFVDIDNDSSDFNFKVQI